jgi:lysophospholipase L1-like esterase
MISRKHALGTALILGECLALAVMAEFALQYLASRRHVAYYLFPPGHSRWLDPAPDIFDGIEGTANFLVNDVGTRGAPPPEHADHFILAIGGSSTECMYLDEDETWPYLLQTNLAAALGSGSTVWVGNAGKAGLRTQDHVLQLRRQLAMFPKTDVVVASVGFNDLVRAIAETPHYEPFQWEDPDSLEWLFDHAFVDRPRTFEFFPLKRTALRHYYQGVVEALGPPPEPTWDDKGENVRAFRAGRSRAILYRDALPDLTVALNEFSLTLRLMAQAADAAGVKLVLVTQPTLWRDDLSPELSRLLWFGAIGQRVFTKEPSQEFYSVRALAEAARLYKAGLLRSCAELSLECLDLDALLPKDSTTLYDDVHFNENGAQRAAAELASFLGPRMAPPDTTLSNTALRAH